MNWCGVVWCDVMSCDGDGDGDVMSCHVMSCHVVGWDGIHVSVIPICVLVKVCRKCTGSHAFSVLMCVSCHVDALA